jgi:hypothetical protein
MVLMSILAKNKNETIVDFKIFLCFFNADFLGRFAIYWFK